jgi:hypothetical protein
LCLVVIIIIIIILVFVKLASTCCRAPLPLALLLQLLCHQRHLNLHARHDKLGTGAIQAPAHKLANATAFALKEGFKSG